MCFCKPFAETAISFWYTVPALLPSTELNGTGALVPLLCAVPLVALTPATSPHIVLDAAYACVVSVVVVVLVANGVHVHHSAWPWSLVPLCRHTGLDLRARASAAAAGIFMGMATQEISGSGFSLLPEEGW
jgi:hypothetical protein